jgi:type IV pilus assembly protein PilY1
MKAGHTYKRLLTAFAASALLAVDVHAASTDIFNQPLSSAAAISAKPNIMFILDNSGSMTSDYMPDDMDNSGKYGFKSAQCNGVAFDPNAAPGTYSPPLKADGTSYANASFTAAASDGFDYVGSNTRASTTSVTVGTGSKTVTIPAASSTSYATGNSVIITSSADHRAWMAGSVTGWNGTTKVLTVDVTETSGSGSFASWDVGFGTNLDNSTYYVYTGTQPRMSWTYLANGSVETSTDFYKECQSQVGSNPGLSTFNTVTVTSASSTTLKQNYANWYSYYHTRRLMMRSATGRAFSTLGSNYRVGFTTISDTGVVNGTNKFVDIGDFDTGKKTDFYNSLYTATGSSNTPLRGALSKVGRYFANKASGQTYDPMQYSCQRNFAILSTDGYWNTGTETSSYGPYKITSNIGVGQQDGTEVKPMHDGAAAIVTTVTTTATTRQEQVVTSNRESTTYRRYVWTISSTLSQCPAGGGTDRYATSIQQQNRVATVDKTTTLVRNVTETTVHTVVTTNGVVSTDSTTGPTTSTATVSSNTVTNASSAGSFSNNGGAVAACSSSGGLTSVGLPSTGGVTVYSSTTDTLCNASTGCNYNATASGPSTGGTQNGGTTTAVLSGPATTVLSGPTATASTTITNSTSGGSSDSLADVAEYYYVTDLRQPGGGLNNCTSGSSGNNVCANDTMSPLGRDSATHQHMTTYTIGLGVNGTLPYQPNYLEAASGTYVQLTNGALNWPVPVTSSSGGDARQIDDLWHAAVNGRGKYFATNNATTLANAVAGALTDAVKVLGAASGAATNSLEPVVGENNQAYIATYETISWVGDVQAYPLDASTGSINTATRTWSARTQLDALGAGSRQIKYMQPGTGTMRNFTFTNLNADGYGTSFSNFCSQASVPAQCATLIPAQITLANNGDNLVNFLRGDDAYENETNLANPLYRERSSKLGDIINGSPVFVKKPPLKYTDAGYSSYEAAQAGRTALLYAPANDGMLHAFDATTGNELWAFVPKFVMPNMYKLANTGYANNHSYFVDGTPVVGDIYVGGAWKTILVGGLNSGGRGYYALDITNPSNPIGLWEFTHADMGLTYGNPIITKRSDGTWVVALTSGLNNTSGDGQGHLYLLNANTGALLENISTGVGSATTPSGLSKINAWVDDPTNNTAKRFYGGDMLGNLWRIDTENLVAPSGKEATLLATFLYNGTTPQPITTAPQLAEIQQGATKYALVMAGTGRYLGNNDLSDTTPQSIYALKDTLTGTGHGDVRASASLVNQTVTVLGATTISTGTSNAVDWASKIGWKMDLPQSKERIVIDMAVQFDTLVAASAIPGANECNPGGGKSWLYAININNGAPADPTGTISHFLGDFLVVGMTWVKTASGESKIEIVGSDASVRTEGVPPPGQGKTQIRRSSWRELIN